MERGLPKKGGLGQLDYKGEFGFKGGLDKKEQGGDFEKGG